MSKNINVKLWNSLWYSVVNSMWRIQHKVSYLVVAKITRSIEIEGRKTRYSIEDPVRNKRK